MSDWLKWESVEEKPVTKPKPQKPKTPKPKEKKMFNSLERTDLLSAVDSYLVTYRTAYRRNRYNQLSETKTKYERMLRLKDKLKELQNKYSKTPREKI